MPGQVGKLIVPPGDWKGEALRILQDSYNRSFNYLRLSVTDACNFRCQYCLPNGYQKPDRVGALFEDRVLSCAEIFNLVSGFVKLGIRKVRITGGEPTIRKDIVSIVESITDIPGIEVVALTTNGYRLSSILPDLKKAGLSALNISLDSLNEHDFEQITGYRHFEKVRESVLEAVSMGFASVKINVVMLKSYLDRNLLDFMAFVREHPVSVRFIELMETGGNSDFFHREYLRGEDLVDTLNDLGWKRIQRSALSGPAFEFERDGYTGRIGVISPYSKDFCSNCNRLRVTSKGKLKLCLFGDEEISIRHMIQDRYRDDDLAEYVQMLIKSKSAAHRLHDGNFGSTASLSAIGG